MVSTCLMLGVVLMSDWPLPGRMKDQQQPADEAVFEVLRRLPVATVNGEVIRGDLVLTRYQEVLHLASMKHPIADFAKLVESILARDTPVVIERIVLSQALRDTLSDDQRRQLNAAHETFFAQEIQKLCHDLNATDLEELKARLRERWCTLEEIREAFIRQREANEFLIAYAPADEPGSAARKAAFGSEMAAAAEIRSAYWPPRFQPAPPEDTAPIRRSPRSAMNETRLRLDDFLNETASAADALRAENTDALTPLVVPTDKLFRNPGKIVPARISDSLNLQ